VTTDFDADEWYSPMESLALLEPHYGAMTKSFIGDKLKDGLVRAHADEVWDSDEPTLTDAWRNRKNAEIERDVMLDRMVWTGSRHWQFDLDQWRWPTNRFVVTRQMSPADRTIALGVKFFSKDIDKLIPEKSNKGGPKPKYEAWAAICNALLKIEREKPIKKSNYNSMADFQRSVLNKIYEGESSNKKSTTLTDDVIKESLVFVWRDQPD
jgi:hypothetical protein